MLVAHNNSSKNKSFMAVARLPNSSLVSRSGFTLIELSIVLVIIGLIVGGVLVGRDLIFTSQINSQITQFSKMTSAMHTFQVKYNSLPGDMNETQQKQNNFTDYYVYGDGNGLVNDDIGFAPASFSWDHEPILFFSHLSDAGLTENYTYHYPNPSGFLSPTAAIPTLKINYAGGFIAVSYNGYVWYFAGINNNAAATAYLGSFSSPVFKPLEAYSMDRKIDDGIPGTGNVIAVVLPSVAAGDPTPIMDNTDSQCVTTSAATAYNLSSSSIWCRLMIKAQ